MASRTRNEPDETAELKRLLFSPELEVLDRVRERTAVLHRRVGDDPALIDSIRNVLVDVLRQSGIENHDRVAAAMAPLVLETIRREIRNSRDAMLETLYPVAGQLVRAAVAQAMREMASAVARPVDSVFSPSLWSARFAAWGSDRTVGEVLLARSPVFVIERVLLIHRPTGLLIADSGDPSVDDAEGQHLAAMLSVTQTFARDALSGQADGAIRGITFSDRELHIACSITSLLAIKTRGPAPDDIESRVQTRLLELSRRWADPIQEFNGDLPASERTALEADLALTETEISGTPAGAAPRRTPTMGLAIVSLAVLALVGWLGYISVQNWRDRQVEAEAAAFVDTPGWLGYPVSFDFDRATHALTATGLAPSPSAAQALKGALGGVKRVERVTMAMNAAGGGSAGASMSAGDLSAGNTTRGDLASRVSSLEKSGQQSAVDPVSRIALWLAQHPIQFDRRGGFQNPPVAEARLDAVAQVLKAWNLDLSLLVAGYAGPREQRGGEASRQRAETVAAALIRRGVPKSRLIVLGRGAERPVAPAGDEANRRVAFEIAWR